MADLRGGHLNEVLKPRPAAGPQCLIVLGDTPR